MFIPKQMQARMEPTRTVVCKWCGLKGLKKEFWACRDGPIEWWFCDREHCSMWGEWRHDRHIGPILKLPHFARSTNLDDVPVEKLLQISQMLGETWPRPQQFKQRSQVSQSTLRTSQ